MNKSLRRTVTKLGEVLMYAVSFVLTLFVPRRANRWTFGSWIGVGEGALAVARELRRRDPGATIYWAVSGEYDEARGDAARAIAEGFTPVRRTGWSGLCATLTSRQLVITHGYGDVNRLGIAGAAITHLGHGVPLKRLHHHIAARTSGPGFKRALLRRMYRAGADRVQVYVAASVTVAERLRTANQVDPGRVLPLGDPRDDEVVAQRQDPARAAHARTRVRELLGLHSDGASTEQLILYAPTWRDGADDPGVPSRAEIESMAGWLEARRARLLIRSHPMGSGAYEAALAASAADRIHMFSAELAPDITPLLGAFDAVITDYSSIALDFSLLARPIVWFAPDLAEYSLTRGLYEPLELTAAGKVAGSWGQTLITLGDVLGGGPAALKAQAESAALAERFHDHPQGGAAGRVLDEIQRLALPAASRVSDGVFFESFEGRQVSCNPLALDREIAERYPGLQRYWSVTSERTEVPEGAQPLLVGGADWHAARKHARLLVVNDWLGRGFRARRSQTVLQTWHGTMLKRLALSRPNSGLQVRVATRRESRRWDVLLSQNPHSTEQFRASYAYTGEILETGYPRDDRLARAVVVGDAGPERIPFVQQAARRTLGVPQDARVLAYVPTWRESTRGSALGRVELLDVDALAATLDTPDDPWVVLVRGHSRTTAVGGYGGVVSRVIDVSSHPDVNDVILAADLLVTDYSSIMFDAAVAAVPMAFFVPDLVDYRDRERGFTFDFESTAPGPLITTMQELVTLARTGVPYSKRYREWRERYVPFDDGQAAKRVLDALEERGVFG